MVCSIQIFDQTARLTEVDQSGTCSNARHSVAHESVQHVNINFMSKLDSLMMLFNPRINSLKVSLEFSLKVVKNACIIFLKMTKNRYFIGSKTYLGHRLVKSFLIFLDDGLSKAMIISP